MARAALRLGHGGGPVCSSAKCVEQSMLLRSYLDLREDPCQDFMKVACSKEKKRRFAERKVSSEFDAYVMATEAKLRWIDQELVTAETMGSRMEPLLSAVKEAYEACMLQTSVSDADLYPSARAFLAHGLPLSREELILQSGFARIAPKEDLEIWGVLMTPLFALGVFMEPGRPSRGLQLFFLPAACPELGTSLESLGFFQGLESDGEAIFGHRLQEMSQAFEQWLKPLIFNRSCKEIFNEVVQAGHFDEWRQVPLAALQDTLDAHAEGGASVALQLSQVLRQAGVPDTAQLQVLNYAGNFSVARWAQQMAAFFARAEAHDALRFSRMTTWLHLTAPTRTCLEQVVADFPWLRARKFVDAVLSPEARDEAEEVAWQIAATFAESLRSSWLDAETSKAALRKLRQIRLKIGYPQWIKDDSFLLQRYAYSLGFKREMGYAWIRQLTALGKFRQIAGSIGSPRDWANFWRTTPDRINAEYNPASNDMIFMAGYMLPPFYDPNAPMSFIFATFGAIVAHELTHAFDNHGALRNEWGDLENWWSKSCEEKFQQQEACFKEEFSSIPVYGDLPSGERDSSGPVFDDGGKCLGENIADAGGLNLAFLAYRRWSQLHGPEPQLHGLEGLGGEQLFFLRFAARRCGYERRSQLERHMKSWEPHALSEVRALGPLRNSRLFSEVFQCRAGTWMNPKQKCELWGVAKAQRQGPPLWMLGILLFGLVLALACVLRWRKAKPTETARDMTLELAAM
ncbi:unnamed protein product [Effrenium voratum]|uniref:Endothelin-converting enzyme 1 n=1 Tax=Effrenium voratum TaxID=2562239 RepID=A0AA36IX23_9DINO|nr:unnamed protein product [Effrenium voratum]CAJ1452390.1 unnamed protein product [Effrenium voratum]